MSPARGTTTGTSRERMLASSIQLLRERGLAGTSFREVVEHSGAPRGSIYHHFPEGKTQLAVESARLSGEAIATGIRRSAEKHGPAEMLRRFIRSWAKELEVSDYRLGCPILAVAVDAPADAPELAEATAAAFTAWQEALEATLGAGGLTPAHSRRLATLMISAIEGAVVMCRAERSTTPLLDVERELLAVLESAGLARRPERQARPGSR